MLNSQNILKGVFVILFIVFASEVFYIFYYQPSLSKKTLTPTTTPTPVPAVIVENNQSASESGNLVKEYLFNAQAKKQDFVSYYDLLKKLMVGSKDKCLAKDCFELENTTEDWISDVDIDSPITITSPFLMRLNIVGNKAISGINLSGRVTEKNQYELWWNNPNSLFVSIGIGGGGKQLYVDARSNGSLPYELYSHNFDKFILGIYILFDQKGKYILITDLAYNKIAFIDINKVTGNKFPDGLFPDNKLYVGYGVPSKANLIIYDLSILSIK